METADRQRKHRNKLLFLMFSGAISIILLVVGGYQLIEFSDSTAFCGQLCHNVMYPEYTAFQASAHSRVLCAQCHVGSGASYLVKSKISGIPLIFRTIAGTYDRPIPTPVENLRPARETCEQCHRPEKFTGDIILTRTTYASDEKNTMTVDNRIMRVGGGETGVAQGIHWHIAARVWYLAMDTERQDIGWIGIEGNDGRITTEYINPGEATKVTPELIAKDKRMMDCIDCHNRATHVFNSPSDLIDTAMTLGTIDNTLPFIKKAGLASLDPPNTSLEEAYTKIDAIKDFYSSTYPQVYQQKQPAVSTAIDALKKVAVLTTFPHMNVTWKTYVSNVGHQDSPGCFRCHGKLVASSGAQKGKTIDADCNLCHHLP